ncbi:MAG: sel1 repeat family protein [Proteobacteria bacterium]|nr:sel1 repeat family protein [Pseudomonadota bacterium]
MGQRWLVAGIVVLGVLMVPSAHAQQNPFGALLQNLQKQLEEGQPQQGAPNKPAEARPGSQTNDSCEASYEARQYKAAVSCWRNLADNGDARAQTRLGESYFEEKGVSLPSEWQEHAEAVKWFRKAADQGYARAQGDLGLMLRHGKGTARDYPQALMWFQKAADQGYASAQYNLGQMYEDGLGVQKDEDTALQWYKKAADQGYKNAVVAFQELQHKQQKAQQEKQKTASNVKVAIETK